MWGVQNADASSDDELRTLLGRTKAIAVLGAKNGPHQDAHQVALYMQHRGYQILPVNPKLETVLGEPVSATLADLDRLADLIVVFRAAAHLPGHTDEILAMSPRPLAVWFQLGIRDDASARRLREAGIGVVQDRCLMVEHRRLLGN